MNKINAGGIFDGPQCKELAKKLIEFYDSDKDGALNINDILAIMSDSYRATNKKCNLTQTDLNGGAKLFDSKEKISVDDVEQLVKKYFLGTPPAAPIKVAREKLTKAASERLEVARRIFKQVDTNKQNYLTKIEVGQLLENIKYLKKQVPNLLKETYKLMGMDYTASEEDVTMWIEMTDSDGDGQVSLEDYEQLILRSLVQQGIKIE